MDIKNQQDISVNNKRIAKNALFLYLRMFLMMGVTLFTSRVILQTLGVEDFGIYNVVAGIVVLFAFINNAMAIASQRFLSFALGKKDDQEVKRVFSMSLTSHIAIAGLILFLAETIGLWVLWKMNFPENRLTAVGLTYHFAVFTCVANILRVPYNAAIIAYERMSFYAWISIFEVIFKLAIVFLLVKYYGDKLILYSFLLFVVTVIINVAYKVYANRKFTTSKYQFYWDKSLFKQFISFSGWSLTGSLANVGAQQGLNMIINVFCGVVVNAAVGISNQVMGAVGQFLSNFQTAFNPQLVKSYATGDKEYFMSLIFKSSKFSYYLMFIISLPAIVNCDFLLKMWLGDVPAYSVAFSQLMLVFLLFDAISGPLWISVQATGKIKSYQLLMSFLILLNLPVAYFLLRYGYSPVYVFIVRVVINIITLIARMLYLRPLIQLSIRKYIVQVLVPIFFVTIISLPLPLWVYSNLETGWTNLLIVSLLSILVTSVLIYTMGLNRGEKQWIKTIIKEKTI